MKRLLLFPVFLTGLQVAGQVAVLEEKFDYHKFTCSVTLQNNFDRKIYLTAINGIHRFKSPFESCGPSGDIVVKTGARYTFLQCSQSPYVVDPVTGARGLLDTVPRAERLKITPLELPPHGIRKFDLAFSIAFNSCGGFSYSGIFDLVFGTDYSMTKEVTFDYQQYLNAPVTPGEIVREIAQNATTDVWYIEKMKKFEWNKAEATALIRIFAGRFKTDSSVSASPGYMQLRSAAVPTPADAIAQTIRHLQLDSLSDILGDFLLVSPSRILIEALLAQPVEEAQRMENRRKVARVIWTNIGSRDKFLAATALEMVMEYRVVELKEELLNLYRSGKDPDLKDFVYLILRYLKINPDEK